MRVLLVIGAPGSGKTTALEALMGALEADDVPYAAVEVEALALVHPGPDDEAAFAHLEHVAASFARRGYETLLVTATVTDSAYLERLRAALPSDDVVVARLEAPVDVLRARLQQREPPDWVGLPRLLAATAELADVMAGLAGIDVAVDTAASDRGPTAARLREALGR